VFVAGDNPYARKGRPPKPSETAVLMECERHGLEVHHLHVRNTGKYRYRCKRCVGEAVTRRHRRVKQILVDEFGGGCVICGYDRVLANLHFHHVDPATKSFGVTMARGRSLAAYREEAKKCVLVCANCHGEIEAGVIPSPPAGTRLAASSPLAP
jgi:cytochrome c553